MNLELAKTSRSRTLAVIVVAMMLIFVARLFWLQVIMHDKYVAMADREQMKRLVIPAKRGMIYSMDGDTPVPLVMNEKVYTVFVDPEIVTEPDEIVEILRRVAGGNMRPDVHSLVTKQNSRYQIVATKVSRKQAEMIKEERLDGLGFQEVSQRVYPEGQLAAQTLGFVNTEGEGQYGVEGRLNDRLKGKDGLLESVTDISNVPLTIGDKNVNISAVDGDDIVLTIDRNVQAYAEQALAAGLERTGAQKGSVLVMDPQTGRVLAMANLPTYKPAEFSKVQDASQFMNAVASSPYEAGSVIKTLTVAMGLDRGVITPEATYVNTDSVDVGGDIPIKNATKGRTGTITMQTALNYSLNTGMVNILQRLGGGQANRQARDTMYDYFYNRFGLAQPTGIEIAGEAGGSLISPEHVNGNAVQYATMSFGQGMNVTMLQVGAALSSIINGGTYYQPTVLGGAMKDGRLEVQTPKTVREGVVGAGSSSQLQQMMESARSEFYGSQDKPGYKIGGKTGTSQTLVDGRYVDEQTIGAYLGYGGDDRPRYVIMVQVSGKDMNLEGGKHAAPIFTDISNWMIDYLKLQPKG